MQEINVALFLRANFLSCAILFPLKFLLQQYMHYCNHMSRIVITWVFFVSPNYQQFALPNWSWASIHFPVINFGTLLGMLLNTFVIFW